jgi:hypothetical protein
VSGHRDPYEEVTQILAELRSTPDEGHRAALRVLLGELIGGDPTDDERDRILAEDGGDQ